MVPPKTLLSDPWMTLLSDTFLNLAFGIRPPRPAMQARRRPLQRKLTALGETRGVSVLWVQGRVGSLKVTG